MNLSLINFSFKGPLLHPKKSLPMRVSSSLVKVTKRPAPSLPLLKELTKPKSKTTSSICISNSVPPESASLLFKVSLMILISRKFCATSRKLGVAMDLLSSTKSGEIFYSYKEIIVEKFTSFCLKKAWPARSLSKSMVTECMHTLLTSNKLKR